MTEKYTILSIEITNEYSPNISLKTESFINSVINIKEEDKQQLLNVTQTLLRTPLNIYIHLNLNNSINLNELFSDDEIQQFQKFIQSKQFLIDFLLFLKNSLIEQNENIEIQYVFLKLPTNDYFKIKTFISVIESVGFQFNSNSNNTIGKNNILINDEIEIYQNIKYKQMFFSFQCPNDRISMKNKLSSYHLHIVSKYFENFNDFVHLEYVGKKMRGNIQRFDYNPIDLNEKQLKHFQNLKTFHFYKKQNKQIPSNQMEKTKKIIVWYSIEYFPSIQMKEKYGKEIEFKHIIYTKSDRNKDFSNEFKKQKQLEKRNKTQSSKNFDYNATIPQNVKEIGTSCFAQLVKLKSISIPASVTKIAQNAFDGCNQLTSLTMILDDTKIIMGRRVLYIEKEMRKFDLPTSVKMLNSFSVSLYEMFQMKQSNILFCVDKSNESNSLPSKPIYHSLQFPEYVESIEEKCFSDISSITSIQFPNKLTKMGKYCFKNCFYLSHVQLPESLTYFDSTWFHGCFSLTSLHFSNGIQKLPKSSFSNWRCLKEITLSTQITSLPEMCFFNCSSLTSISNVNQIKSIGKKCFEGCSNEIKLLEKELINKMFILNEDQISQIYNWTILNVDRIIFDTDIHQWNKNKCELFDKIKNKSQLLFVIESTDGNVMGYFQFSSMKLMSETIDCDSSSFLFKHNKMINSKNDENNNQINQKSTENEYELEKYSETTDKGYTIFDNHSNQMITLGGCTSCISLTKEDWKEYCKFDHFVPKKSFGNLEIIDLSDDSENNENYRNNHNVNNNKYANNDEKFTFTLKRMIVIQMI